jgi:hypothetical protein
MQPVDLPQEALPATAGMAFHGLRTLAWLATFSLLLAGCSADGAASTGSLERVYRRGQLGSLRDFVLYVRPQDRPGTALLVDRFEVTQDDWVAFAKTEQGLDVAARSVGSRGSGALPASGMSLQQARAFAHWRLGRLPTEAEWRRATVAGGSSPFPWGAQEFATHANSGNLGLGEPTPVGSFESGRRAGGNWPYDLIGNVREWTETVPGYWCTEVGIVSSFTANRRRVLATPALSVWSTLRLVAPAMIATVGPGAAPRRVVGVDFETPLSDIANPQDASQMGDERRPRTGMRVYTTVDELLGRLLRMIKIASAEERLQLVRFVARKGHRKVLTAAFLASPFAKQEFPDRSIAAVISSELLIGLSEPK